jgi:hypothetical protein
VPIFDVGTNGTGRGQIFLLQSLFRERIISINDAGRKDSVVSSENILQDVYYLADGDIGTFDVDPNTRRQVQHLWDEQYGGW